MVDGRAPVKLPYPPIDKNAFPSLSRIEQERLYLDFQALADAGDGTRWGTLVIAPSDATTASKRKADYTLDGITDSDRMQAAVDAIANRGRPGRIVILEGTVFLTDQLLITMTTEQQLTIEGQGSTQGYSATMIQSTYSGGAAIKVNGTNGFTGNTGYTIFRNLGVDNADTGQDGIATNAANVEVDACSINAGGIGCFLDGGLSGPYRPDFVHDSRIHGGSRGMELRHRFGGRISNNYISGVATGIRSFADASAKGNLVITGNEITAATGIWLVDSLDSTNTCNTLIGNNRIYTCSTAGIVCTSTKDIHIIGNIISECGFGIDVGSGVLSGNERCFITGNYIYDTTGTRHVRIGNSTLGTSDYAVCFNKFRGTTPAYAVEINGNNNACAYNDTYNGYSTAALLDNGSNTRREEDFFGSPGTLVPAGGTAGQLLAKVSATDGDVTWVTDYLLAAMAATGDLVVGTGAGTITTLHKAGALQMGESWSERVLVTSSDSPGVKWGPTITVGSVAPTNPQPGDIWLDTT